jgi:hypothetical protein
MKKMIFSSAFFPMWANERYVVPYQNGGQIPNEPDIGYYIIESDGAVRKYDYPTRKNGAK